VYMFLIIKPDNNLSSVPIGKSNNTIILFFHINIVVGKPAVDFFWLEKSSANRYTLL